LKIARQNPPPVLHKLYGFQNGLSTFLKVERERHFENPNPLRH
jgi:hypothetical protein